MNSTRFTVLFGTALGLLQFGCGGTDPASHSTQRSALVTPSDTQSVDVSGTWYARVSTRGSIKAIYSDKTVAINAWIRNYVSPTGEITFSICKLSTVGSVLAPGYSQALVKTLETTVPQEGSTLYRIGDSIPFPTFTVYSGQDATGKSIDAAPPPFPGGDSDGKPGVTIPTMILNLFTINVYAGLVITISLNDVALVDATTLTGNTSFSSHGTLFGSTSSFLVKAGSSIDVATNDPTIPFSATKLDSDGSTTCAEIAKLP
jgi:hypothetical protein